MVDNLSSVEVARGRRLAVGQWGDPAGRAVFWLHGTPGSRMRRPVDEAAVRDAGLRVITYDRPGYGGSDRHPQRRVVDCVDDVAAIADALDVDRFWVTGGSGGGPHALAVAARLPDRVVAAEAVVCPAPYDAPDIDFFAGMDPENVREFGWALQGEQALHGELAREATAMLERLDLDRPSEVLGAFELDAADQAVLARPDVSKMFGEAIREALRPGAWGWVDDDLAMLAPWGFDLSEIQVPLTIRYGAKDVLVPAAHGAWLASHLPHARVVVETSAGHLVSPEGEVEHLRELVPD